MMLSGLSVQTLELMAFSPWVHTYRTQHGEAGLGGHSCRASQPGNPSLGVNKAGFLSLGSPGRYRGLPTTTLSGTAPLPMNSVNERCTLPHTL